MGFNVPGKPVLLVILDGWAFGPFPEVSAIAKAHTPFFDSLLRKYPWSTLMTHGTAVGLPPRQMGNSEVGHMNIGAGRVVWQDIMRIFNAIKDGSLEKNPVIKDAAKYAIENNVPIHLMGLVSDGGVHSHIDHLKALIDIFYRYGVPKIYVHAFTDGRDTDIHLGASFVEDIITFGRERNATVVSVIGRYYAMDRDKRWERIKKAYDLLVHGVGTKTQDIVAEIKMQYQEGNSDEFLEPIVLVDNDERPIGRLQDRHVAFCFNFRTDRCRQLVTVLTQKEMPEFEMKPLDLYCITMTEYDKTFKNIKVVFKNEPIKNTLGEVVSNYGFQLRIAETEKYPHVTYFFSGGREVPFAGEDRILISSPKVPTYDLKPEMSAYEVTDALIPKIEERKYDLIVLNFANPDMVGHTGVFEAAVKAVEAVDRCNERVVSTALKNGYSVIVTADHGNADVMVNPDGTPHTAHTKNPVPFIVIDDRVMDVYYGKLGDIAPTILNLMNLSVPEEMTGKSLVLLK